MKKQTKNAAIQFIKYGLVGVMNSLITLIVIFVCNDLIGLKLMLADVIGYIAGLINSFVFNKNWVFKSHDKNLKIELSLFAIGFLVCFGLQFLTVLWLRNPMKALDISFLNFNPDTVGEYIAVCAGMVVYTVSNFIYNRCITFKANAD